MHIALFGATGNIGRHIAQEALRRGHAVTALVRRTQPLPSELDGASIVLASLDDRAALAAAVRGHDVLASAYGPSAAAADTIPAVAQALIEVARDAGVQRLLVVGGAGSLEVAPGVQLVDTPNFPDAYKPYALAHRASLQHLQAATDLEWTFFAPAAEIGPGDQRGGVRTQATALLSDAQGHSAISYADYASAFVDEIERPQYLRQIATAAY
ncbi:hypothetical protein HDC36_002912 [Xanthomonas sp. JAI131]|uniref:NAD(P)-dependent oxidoreductase n=1 Tax=Xanthomonas sp. JAI131 TaxID=2723067 RepID=UPI0015C955A7|nr:NAD(P)H-binding protein [Xanthomonas sp. JAI131]NYF21443.1 hypothetical protein [Xanthomonas sp. JAI131]